MNYLTLACEHLGITAAQVLASAEKETEIVLVVDNGIAGCPKYRIPLELLHEKVEPEPEMPPDLPAQAGVEAEVVPEIEVVPYTATAGAERQARMSGVSLSNVAEWAGKERITVNTVRDYVRRGTIRLTARRGDK